MPSTHFCFLRNLAKIEKHEKAHEKQNYKVILLARIWQIYAGASDIVCMKINEATFVIIECVYYYEYFRDDCEKKNLVYGAATKMGMKKKYEKYLRQNYL